MSIWLAPKVVGNGDYAGEVGWLVEVQIHPISSMYHIYWIDMADDWVERKDFDFMRKGVPSESRT